jgi:predicted transcriptional regulator
MGTNKLAKFLKTKRAEKGMSLRDFAKVLNISHGFLDKIEKGKYDKQPCDMCGYWENIVNNGHNDDIKYCTQCGRKLEEWRKNK